MIGGYFDRHMRPRVWSLVVIPRLTIAKDVLLRIDTGADVTCIHPLDGRALGIPYERLTGESSVQGIGGDALCYSEVAFLSFEDGASAAIHRVELLIAEPTPDNEWVPSLLGLDILNQMVHGVRPSERKNRVHSTLRDPS